MIHKAVLLLQQIRQYISWRKLLKVKRPREILPPVRTFCFDHFTVQNQIDAKIKRSAIWRQTNCGEFVIRRVRRREHNLRNKCFPVLQTCHARGL